MDTGNHPAETGLLRLRLLSAAATVALTVTMAACGSPSSAPALPPVAPSPALPTATTAEPVPQPSAPATTASVAPAPVPTTPGGCLTVAALPVRQQLAQLLMVGVDPAGSAQAIDVVAQGVGGIFIGGDADGLLTSGALGRLGSSTPLGVMVAVDEEGGRVQRIDALAGSMPSAREMVAAGKTPQQVHDTAFARGQQLLKYGVTVDFAPDADVSGQPDDTVIGDRSFSADPATATLYAGAFAQGLRDAGVLPVLKHFPGHGASSGDSHKGTVSSPPLAALQTRDLVPFRQLITAGFAPGVMVGHLEVPGLTEPGVPASLSPKAISLLRNGIGYGAAPFGGVVFSDDLAGMAAITAKYDVPQAVLDTLQAGSDVALFITANRLPAVLDYLQKAVADTRLSLGRVHESLVRVLKAKNVPLCA